MLDDDDGNSKGYDLGEKAVTDAFAKTKTQIERIRFEGCWVGDGPADMAAFGRLFNAREVSGFTWRALGPTTSTVTIPKGLTAEDLQAFLDTAGPRPNGWRPPRPRWRSWRRWREQGTRRRNCGWSGSRPPSTRRRPTKTRTEIWRLVPASPPTSSGSAFTITRYAPTPRARTVLAKDAKPSARRAPEFRLRHREASVSRGSSREADDLMRCHADLPPTVTFGLRTG